MARIVGVKERLDVMFYDTNRIEPGNQVDFFGRKNMGSEFHTNIQVPNQLASDQTYILMAIGVRLIGKTREQWARRKWLRLLLRV